MSSKIQALFVPALLALLALPQQAWAQGVTAADLEAKVEALLAEPVRRNRFSGSILVYREGKTLLAKGYGLANREHGIKNGPETKFCIGSMTKQFTAMAIHLLEKRGKLSRSDPLSKYFPKYKNARGVTINHCLRHCSGIPNFTSLAYFGKIRRRPQRLDALIERLYPLPLLYKPGQRGTYSNSNFIILTRIVELASGRTYLDFFNKDIFKKLHLKDTGFASHSKIIKHRASGYTSKYGFMTNADYIDMTVPNGAGAMYSTVLDLLTWCKALKNHSLLTEEETKEYLKPNRFGFASGLIVRGEPGHREIMHGGAIDGFRSFMTFIEESETVIVVLCNLESCAPGAVARKIGTILASRRPRSRRVRAKARLY